MCPIKVNTSELFQQQLEPRRFYGKAFSDEFIKHIHQEMQSLLTKQNTVEVTETLIKKYELTPCKLSTHFTQQPKPDKPNDDGTILLTYNMAFDGNPKLFLYGNISGERRKTFHDICMDNKIYHDLYKIELYIYAAHIQYQHIIDLTQCDVDEQINIEWTFLNILYNFIEDNITTQKNINIAIFNQEISKIIEYEINKPNIILENYNKI